MLYLWVYEYAHFPWEQSTFFFIAVGRMGSLFSLFTSQPTIFQSCRDGSSLVKPTLLVNYFIVTISDLCHLLLLYPYTNN